MLSIGVVWCVMLSIGVMLIHVMLLRLTPALQKLKIIFYVVKQEEIVIVVINQEQTASEISPIHYYQGKWRDLMLEI